MQQQQIHKKEREIIPLAALAEGLFDDASALSPLMELDIRGVRLGMSEFQLEHFVLNRREFPTDFAQFMQAKLELHHRVNVLFDLWYRYRKALAEIKLAEGEIEKIECEEDKFVTLREAKIELQRLEIEKNGFIMRSLKQEASDKLSEALFFARIYKQLNSFEKMTREEIARFEEETWKIKSAYYSELQERYGLFPHGFEKLPHEKGGLKSLIETQNAGGVQW